MPLQSRQKAEQPLAPSCSLPFALPAQDTRRHSHSPGAAAHRASPVQGLETEQPLVPLIQPLQGVFLPPAGTKALHAGTCRLLFPSYQAGHRRIKQPNWIIEGKNQAKQHLGQCRTWASWDTNPVQHLSCHPHHELQPDIQIHKMHVLSEF